MGSAVLCHFSFLFIIVVYLYFCHHIAIGQIIMSTISLNLKMQVSYSKGVGTPFFV